MASINKIKLFFILQEEIGTAASTTPTQAKKTLTKKNKNVPSTPVTGTAKSQKQKQTQDKSNPQTPQTAGTKTPAKGKKRQRRMQSLKRRKLHR